MLAVAFELYHWCTQSSGEANWSRQYKLMANGQRFETSSECFINRTGCVSGKVCKQLDHKLLDSFPKSTVEPSTGGYFWITCLIYFVVTAIRLLSGYQLKKIDDIVCLTFSCYATANVFATNPLFGICTALIAVAANFIAVVWPSICHLQESDYQGILVLRPKQHASGYHAVFISPWRTNMCECRACCTVISSVLATILWQWILLYDCISLHLFVFDYLLLDFFLYYRFSKL